MTIIVSVVSFAVGLFVGFLIFAVLSVNSTTDRLRELEDEFYAKGYERGLHDQYFTNQVKGGCENE